MKKKIKYTDGEIGDVKILKDFLPSPDELFPNEENVKVTINLSKQSLLFYKKIAKMKKQPYQRLIRKVVDSYAQKFN